MPKWTDYTIKTEPADNDEVMALDTAGKANKRLGLSALSDWILNKLADKVFQKLKTDDKTVLGAINELNSKTLSALRQVDDNVEDWNNIASPGIYSGNGSTSKNAPIEDAIWINAFVVPSNGNVRYLAAYAITGKGIFFRNMSGGRWEAWLQLK